MAEASLLDLKGLNCPLPVLRTGKALRALAAGDLLIVEATDPMAAIDIPHFCREQGHRLVEEKKEGAVLRFIIARGA
ncbi:response regulator SirA [Pleomorphomonas diazotrophica]|uniref:Response regulator SirA n=1 Tax=Pleomorphomonas diazotrophica TaxID=1166257 RepID=A0A1I4RWI5_9HYPH|nr:sulfurtransferase TusA family protein [Pleomorphomonas diazotrophica]PKR88001.1 response regulator SirA [Pleomorphomonas diazotrophica]SFM56597.1 tRNA 2-thiouridine synthesizing protein A [Pleomorphomonas diazotrophica]